MSRVCTSSNNIAHIGDLLHVVPNRLLMADDMLNTRDRNHITLTTTANAEGRSFGAVLDGAPGKVAGLK